jgi:hypothetical protein
MKISRKNAARLASLTAVGAGVFAISPTAAEASIIYTPENITLTPPTSSGANFATITVTNAFKLGFTASNRSSDLFVDVRAGAGTLLKTWTYAGNTWNNAYLSGSTPRLRVGSSSSVNSQIYALFKFTPQAASHSDYGWVQLNEGINSSSQLSLHISGVAYDTTGATIPAGAGVTPEPSPLSLTGLGLLVMGAEALRRFRAAKKAA